MEGTKLRKSTTKGRPLNGIKRYDISFIGQRPKVARHVDNAAMPNFLDRGGSCF